MILSSQSDGHFEEICLKACEIVVSQAMRKCVLCRANYKGADQPAHPRSLISAIVVRCLDSIISLDSIAEISRH